MAGLIDIKDTIMGLVQPVTSLIDELHTSDEERLTLKQKFFELQVSLYNKVLDYEGKIVDAQAKIVTAEAQGESWLQRNWRPLMMITFMIMVLNRWTGITALLGFPTVMIPESIEMELWGVIKLGIGGYVAGRSIEKIAPSVAAALGQIKGKDE